MDSMLTSVFGHGCIRKEYLDIWEVAYGTTTFGRCLDPVVCIIEA